MWPSWYHLRQMLKVGVALVYLVWSVRLKARANRYLIDKGWSWWISPLQAEAKYRPEGLAIRRKARQVESWGFLVVLVAVLFL